VRIIPLRKLIVAGIVLLMMPVAFGQSSRVRVPAPPTLSYRIGGDPREITDPGLDVVAAKRRYVCSTDGNDADNGLTQATAWATVRKVVAEQANIPQGSIIAFCRGGSWAGFAQFNGVQWGDPGNITAFGAYGTGNPPQFSRDVRFYDSSYFIVRDWRAQRFVTELNTHDFAFAYNTCAATDQVPSNCMPIGGPSYQGVLVENFLYDINQNDFISVHTSGANSDISNRDGWWIMDNRAIGSEGAEDCIDVSTSNLGDPVWGSDGHLTKDIKVVGNKCAMQALNGTSTLTGRTQTVIQVGHSGAYTWVVGNIGGYTKSTALYWGTSGNPNRDWGQVSGNVFFDVATNWENNSVNCIGGDTIEFSHNTFLHDGSTRNVVDTACAGIKINHNIIYFTNADNQEYLVTTQTPDPQIVAMDGNWYGSGTNRLITDDQTLAQRQRQTAFDDNSQQGDLVGITAPAQATWGDPRDWDDRAFLALLTPDNGWRGCKGASTPGAFGCAAADAAGAKLGHVINPITGAPNNGCGWNGGDFAPLVKAKLIELGITYTNCAKAWGF
jgi:hypothetical protein